MKKTRNVSGLVIYSHLKDISALRAVKRDADFFLVELNWLFRLSWEVVNLTGLIDRFHMTSRRPYLCTKQ